MSKKVWAFEVDGNEHTVELDHNSLTLSGEVFIDGKHWISWGWSLRSREIPFEVGGKNAVLKFIVNHLSRNKQDLYVNDILIKESR
ncbi:hypothetical protein ACFLXV_04135 [Chloroflexota bacterium]